MKVLRLSEIAEVKININSFCHKCYFFILKSGFCYKKNMFSHYKTTGFLHHADKSGQD